MGSLAGRVEVPPGVPLSAPRASLKTGESGNQAPIWFVHQIERRGREVPVDPAKPLRVILVEDHTSFRQALALVLDREPEFTVVEQAGSLAEARRAAGGIDVAIVDLALPDGNGADLIEDLRRLDPGVTVLVLSATLDRTNFAAAVEAGADGVLDKLAGPGEIAETVRHLTAGQALPRQKEIVGMLRLYGQRRGRDRGPQPAMEWLTPLESKVLLALARGLTARR
jgi:two-component system nitrate/nitrite response regulator NarL